MAIAQEPAVVNNGVRFDMPTADGSDGYFWTTNSAGQVVIRQGAYANISGTPVLGDAAFVNLSALLQSANNLNDLTSASTARTNLGLATVAHSGSYLDLSNQLVNGTGLSLTGTTFSITPTITAGSIGSSTLVPVLTYNAEGQLTAVSSTSLTGVGTLTAGTWNATKIGLAYGGTNADLSGTGGASEVLMQTSTGAGITVRQLANTDITGFGTLSTQNSNALNVSGVESLTGLPSAVNPSDAVPLSQVQSLVATGLHTWDEVQAVLTSNVSISSPGSLTDGSYTVLSGDKILLTNQSTGSQNGPWIYSGSSSALTRPTEYAHASSQTGGVVYVAISSTSTHFGQWWVLTTTSLTVDTTSTTWVQSNQASYTQGTGITITGNVIGLTNSAITIAGTSTPLGGSIGLDTITGLASTGLVKRSGANTLAIAAAGTDYAAPTSGSSLLYGNGAGGFSNATVTNGVSFSTGTLGLAPIAAYSVLANTTNASALPTASQTVTLGTPGYSPTGSSPINTTLTANNYAQIQVQNLSNGSSASSDIVATADNGNDSVNYINMGINSSVGGVAPFTAANGAYVYTPVVTLDIAALGTSGVVNLSAGNGAGTQTKVAAFSAGLVAITGVTNLAAGSLSANTPNTITQTWNNSGVLFNGLTMTITDTASNAASMFVNLFNGATSEFSVDKNGNTITAGTLNAGGGSFFVDRGTGQTRLYNQAVFGWTNNASASGTLDTMMNRRGAANISLGNIDAASPVAQTQSVQGVIAGTSNTSGADWTFAASQGTGTGAGGRFVWKVAPAGSTGTAQNALANAMILDSTKLLTLSGGLSVSGVATFSAGVSTPLVNLGNSGTSPATIDPTAGAKQKITITGACTLALTTPAAAISFTLYVYEDGTGHVYNLPSGVNWFNATTPTPSTAAGKVDVYSLSFDGTNWYGSGGNYK